MLLNKNTQQKLLNLGQWAGIIMLVIAGTMILVMGFWRYVIHDIFGWGMLSYMGGFFTSAVILSLIGLVFTLRETSK